MSRNLPEVISAYKKAAAKLDDARKREYKLWEKYVEQTDPIQEEKFFGLWEKACDSTYDLVDQLNTIEIELADTYAQTCEQQKRIKAELEEAKNNLKNLCNKYERIEAQLYSYYMK